MGIKNRKKSWLPVNFIEQKKIEKLAQYTRLKKSMCLWYKDEHNTVSVLGELKFEKKMLYAYCNIRKIH